MKPKKQEERETILREHAASTLMEVENRLSQADKEAAINEIQEYGAAEFAHGFAAGRQFKVKSP